MTHARLDSVHLARPNRPAAAERARRLLAAIDAAAVRVRGGGDAAAIHDLRVACRRLSSTLATWSHAIDPMAGARARRGLRRLRRGLSRAREREVLAEQLGELLAGEALAVREAGIAELERLARRVAADRRRATRRARRVRIARLVMRVEVSLASFAWDSEPVHAQARARFAARRITALDALTRAAEGGDEALHRARIAVKQWRYTFESLEEAPGDDARATVETLRRLQQCLGEIHDAAVLRDFISRRASRALAKGHAARREALGWLREKADQARWRALERLPAAIADATRQP
jgi:CHAD domain-containing protein